MNKPKVLIVTLKKWNLNNFKKFKQKNQKKIKLYLISNKDKLKKYSKKNSTRFYFFIHWSQR